MKEYIKPTANIYCIHSVDAVLMGISNRVPGGGDDNAFSKGDSGDWEDDDDLDGGSAIW